MLKHKILPVPIPKTGEPPVETKCINCGVTVFVLAGNNKRYVYPDGTKRQNPPPCIALPSLHIMTEAIKLHNKIFDKKDFINFIPGQSNSYPSTYIPTEKYILHEYNTPERDHHIKYQENLLNLIAETETLLKPVNLKVGYNTLTPNEAKLKDAYMVIRLLYEDMIIHNINTRSRHIAGTLLYSAGYTEIVKELESKLS